MGTTINGERASVDAIVISLEANEQVKAAVAAGKMPPDELLDKVLPMFGVVHAGMFFTVWNEYYEDYNPSYEFCHFVALYYNLVDVWGDRGWSFSSEAFSYGTNALDVADELGIELDGEYDEDE